MPSVCAQHRLLPNAASSPPDWPRRRRLPARLSGGRCSGGRLLKGGELTQTVFLHALVIITLNFTVITAELAR